MLVILSRASVESRNVLEDEINFALEEGKRESSPSYIKIARFHCDYVGSNASISAPTTIADSRL